MALKFTEIF